MLEAAAVVANSLRLLIYALLMNTLVVPLSVKRIKAWVDSGGQTAWSVPDICIRWIALCQHGSSCL